MLTETPKFKGRVTIELFGPDGELKDKREINNMVVTAGLSWIAARCNATPPNLMSHMAVGTDNTAASAGQTALLTEVGRVALTSTTTTTVTNSYVASFPAGTGTGALVEAGIFNATPAGTMLCRTVFPVVNKGANDGMTITWDVTAT